MNLNAVDFKDTDITHLADLPAVEQFHLASALIEIVAQGDAVAPALDLLAFRPGLDVNGVARFEHLAKGADVD